MFALLLGILGLLGPLAFSTAIPRHEELGRELAAVDQLIVSSPEDAALHLRRGELHRLAGAWTAAWADYDRAAELQAPPALIQRCRARQWLDMGDATRALAIADELMGEFPGAAVRAESVPGAGADSEPASVPDPAAHPETGPLWLLKAEALDALDRPCEAGPAWRRAVEAAVQPEPDEVDAAIAAYLACGDEQGALAAAEAGLDRLGACLAIELRALQLERDLARYADALARVDRLAAGSARPERWHVRRGQIHQQSGQPELAHAEWRRAREALDRLPEHVRQRGATRQLDQTISEGLANGAPR